MITTTLLRQIPEATAYGYRIAVPNIVWLGVWAAVLLAVGLAVYGILRRLKKDAEDVRKKKGGLL